MNGPKHYRIRDTLTELGVHVTVEVFTPVKETPEGYWVVGQYDPTWMTFDQLRRRRYVRWVSKNSTKRYCYPNLADALRSYKRRKERQVDRLRTQLEQAEKALNERAQYEPLFASEKSEQTLRAGVIVGKIPSQEGWVWDW